MCGSLFAAPPLFETTLVFPFAPGNKPNYRIPAVLQAPNGDILIFAEKRNDGPGDVGDHDIVLKRSRDKGRSWSAEQMVFADDHRTSTDITVGLDRSNGTIWLFFLRDKKKYHYFTSNDNGATWRGPVSVHDQVVKPEWDKLHSGKGEDADPDERHTRHGLGQGLVATLWRRPRQCDDPAPLRSIAGAGAHREDIGGGRLRSFSHAFYSDDHGATWKLGGTVGVNTSECQLVELAGGDVMVIARNESAEDAPDNLRHLTAISHDGGETWGPVRARRSSSRHVVTAAWSDLPLLQSKTGTAFSLAAPHRLSARKSIPMVATTSRFGSATMKGKPGPPAKPSGRTRRRIRISSVLDDMTIGYVYERGGKGATHYWDELCFARFNLQWLTDGRDSLPSPKS